MEGTPRIFYGPFACMLLHEPYLWMRNWTPTIENTADLNATNPAFSLSIASRGRDIISSQIDRDAYLMDIARLPAEMRLMPTCTSAGTSETDRLELPGPNALLRMNRETLEAARAKLEALVREIQNQAETFGRNMLNIVVMYDTKTTPNEGIPYIQLPLQAMAKKLEELRGALAAQLDHTIRVLSLHAPPAQSDPRRGVDSGVNSSQSPPPFGAGHAQMMQSNAGNPSSSNVEEPWRPQRGLPERSVTLLRAWLFENFLHPYPKDSDKQLLARRAGLSRNQVSNWFINARVRLWKPMVEDMCEIDPEDDSMHAEDDGYVENAEALGAHDQQVPPDSVPINDRANGPAVQNGSILQGDHYPVSVANSQAGLLISHHAGTGTDSGLFQGLDPGSQPRLSWRAEMEHDMQTWITIASGAQHEHSPLAQASRLNVSEHAHRLANSGNGGAITIPLELGLPEPRNHFDMLGERERTQNLSAHLGSTIQMAGRNQGQPSNLFLALDSQRTAANLFGPSTLGYSWNHQQSVTLSLSNPENFPTLSLPLGAAFQGFSSSSGFARDPNGNDPSAAGGVSLTLGLQLRNPDLPSAIPETRISNSLPLLDNFNPGFSYNGHADLEMPPGAEQ